MGVARTKNDRTRIHTILLAKVCKDLPVFLARTCYLEEATNYWPPSGSRWQWSGVPPMKQSFDEVYPCCKEADVEERYCMRHSGEYSQSMLAAVGLLLIGNGHTDQCKYSCYWREYNLFRFRR